MASNRIHYIFLFVISKEDSIFYATNYWNHIVQSKTFWVFTHLDIFSLQLHANGFKFSFWNLDFTFTKIGYLNLMCVFFNNCLHSGKLYLPVYFSVQSVTVSVNFLVLYICLTQKSWFKLIWPVVKYCPNNGKYIRPQWFQHNSNVPLEANFAFPSSPVEQSFEPE